METPPIPSYTILLQTFKSSCKKHFFQCACYWYNLFRWIFILCDNWKTFVLKKAYRYPAVFFNHHIVAFFENSILKEVRILCYPQNNRATFKFKIKLSSHITHLYKQVGSGPSPQSCLYFQDVQSSRFPSSLTNFKCIQLILQHSSLIYCIPLVKNEIRSLFLWNS